MGGRPCRRGIAAAMGFVFAAGVARADSRVIDSHTAMVPAHGELRLEIGAGPEGSVLTSAGIGLFERLSLGLSYGMSEVIGRGTVVANPRPGIQFHALVLDQPGLPAIGIGWDSQGHGRWVRELDRYERKSPGFYAVATQNLVATSYDLLSAISGGINYSLEPNRQAMDLFLGVSQTFGRGLALLLDYDFALDDSAAMDGNRGYLDAGLQWKFGSGTHLRFLLRDLFGNYGGQGKVARELNFFYMLNL
jgi:hypothetical protein